MNEILAGLIRAIELIVTLDPEVVGVTFQDSHHLPLLDVSGRSNKSTFRRPHLLQEL